MARLLRPARPFTSTRLASRHTQRFASDLATPGSAPQAPGTATVPVAAATAAATAPARTTVTGRRPVGGLRGGLLGFLLGVSGVGAWGYYHLFEEYQSASNLLLLSVEDLKATTTKMSNHISRIERVEKSLEELSHRATTQDELDKLRGEFKKTYDGLHLELLDAKAHLWGVEQDLQAFEKASGRKVKA